MDSVVCVQLSMPAVQPLPGFSDHTDLLSSVHRVCRFPTHTVLCFLDPAMTKGPGVGGVFNDVPPLGGEWTLEVAVELPDLLPSIGGKSEAVVDARDMDGATRKLCLSNRLSRFHYLDGQTAYHVLLPRTQEWHGAVQVKGAGGVSLTAEEEQLRTVAAMRFQVKGETAETAFEASIKTCLETLFDCINAVLRATCECGPGFAPMSRSVRRESTSSAYILMCGAGKSTGARLALNGRRISLHPPELQGEQAVRFRAIADGSLLLSDVDRLIGAAWSSREAGEYEFALLQAVIAAEIATSRAVRAECLRRGVSTRKEMTYSWALNNGLPLCFPPTARPRAELISAMNTARAKRNELMHNAVFKITHSTRAELGQLVAETKEYVDALEAAKGFGLSSNTKPETHTQSRRADAVADQCRERAYYAWLNRGKPLGDDWTDWFGAVKAMAT
jgi:hypothetical protein